VLVPIHFVTLFRSDFQLFFETSRRKIRRILLLQDCSGGNAALHAHGCGGRSFFGLPSFRLVQLRKPQQSWHSQPTDENQPNICQLNRWKNAGGGRAMHPELPWGVQSALSHPELSSFFWPS